MVSIREAAQALGLSEQRLRQLAAAGRIPSEKIGRQWLFDRAALDPASRRVAAGRPLSAANAWAVLCLLDGGQPRWADAAVRYRLRRRIAEEPDWVVRALGTSEPRSVIHSWRVLPGDLERLRRDQGIVVTGLAAGRPDIDIYPDPSRFDGYAALADVARIQLGIQPLERSSEPNVRLRVPVQLWVLAMGTTAPRAVVAADLLDDGDPRVERAAIEALNELAHRSRR
jgi:excisionase family DNA binding protein